jgi:hypothetical protein
MKIYIPTFKRIDNQITFDNLPDEIKENVILVVQEQERNEHKSDCEYLVIDDDIGIAKTREIIYYHAGKKRFAMLDDDLKIFRRNRKYYGETSNMEKSKRQILYEDFTYMLDEFNTIMDDDDVMHIGMRDTALPPNGKRYYFNSLVLGAHFIDGSKLSRFIDDVDWNYVKTGEDTLINLEFLTRGYKSVISDEFAINGKENFGKKGGCSSFRDSNSDEAEHMKLVERYGEHIIRPTDEFYDLKHMGKHRKFKIDCKSAYKSSQVNTLEKFL